MTKANTAWHYTTGDCLASILRDGVIWLATEGVPPGVKPALWLTLSETFPLSARKGIIRNGRRCTATLDEMIEHASGLARIGIDAARVPRTWADYRRMSGDDRRMLRHLEDSARECGDDPSSWRVSFFPLYAPEWRAVERWNGSLWTSDRSSGVSQRPQSHVGGQPS